MLDRNIAGGGALGAEEDQMTQTELDVGPIDFLMVEFPGAKLTGEPLAELVDLTERGIIRVLDLRVAVVRVAVDDRHRDALRGREVGSGGVCWGGVGSDR